MVTTDVADASVGRRWCTGRIIVAETQLPVNLGARFSRNARESLPDVVASQGEHLVGDRGLKGAEHELLEEDVDR